MKKRIYSTIIVLVLLSISAIKTQAQIYRASFDGHNSVVLGDFADKTFNSPTAGYSNFAYGGHFTAQVILPNNLGIGLRFTGNRIEKDFNTYKDDLLMYLGVKDDKYTASLPFGYTVMGFSFGLSYVFDFNSKFELEPYFYLGFNGLISPSEQVVFYNNSLSKTLTYRKEGVPYVGITYTPGLKFQYNFGKHVGINIYLEYEGASYYAVETEDIVVYSNDSFNKISKDAKLNPQLLNIGLGLCFSIGKGLNN